MYKKIIICLSLMLALSSCSLIRKQKIEQGNLITPQQMSQLHVGMSEEQVRAVMGNPVLLNIFTPNGINYVYTYQPGNGVFTEKRVVCIFRNGRLVEIKR